ncbi:OmpA family protein [uncultured Cocleimonas sp.]|uniref:OmpA family protein n=1 Tax=uncultured Cocleimonas sp. TaxID=1051587 RepID=UPI00262FFAC2|nr:OmpA family protein [uncultured Cocleimonas sp.]
MKLSKNVNLLFSVTSALIFNAAMSTSSIADIAKPEAKTAEPKTQVNKEISKLLADARKNNLYQQCGKEPLAVEKEDYKKNFMSLRGLTGIYVNIDDIIKGAKTRDIILPENLKQTVIDKLKVAGMTLLNKEDIKLIQGQPELSVFASYPKHLSKPKEGEPAIQFNSACCLASTWTSFQQGAKVLRDSKTSFRLSTWGEGHSTSDCSNLTEWYQDTVLKTIENFIETKVKADKEYEKEQNKALLPKSANPDKSQAKNSADKVKLENKKTNEKKDTKAKDDTSKKTDQKNSATKINTSSKLTKNDSSCEILSPEFLELFDSDESAINVEKVGSLDKVIDVMKNCTRYNFIVETHSDSRSEIEYNKKLSLERADTLKNYLYKKGIHQSRFTTQAFGETKPLLKGASNFVHITNRRVVIRPLLIDEPNNEKKEK